MEKAGSVVRGDLALSALRSIEILSQVVQLLGGEVVSPCHDEVVLEIEGFVLTLNELTQNFVKGTQTSSTAHFISSASILYIGGTTCTGMLTSLSESIRPTWLLEDDISASSSAARSAGLGFALERKYSVRDLIEG